MSSLQRIRRLLGVFCSYQQIDRVERGIHASGIVRAHQGLDPDLVKNPFGNLRIGG